MGAVCVLLSWIILHYRFSVYDTADSANVQQYSFILTTKSVNQSKIAFIPEKMETV